MPRITEEYLTYEEAGAQMAVTEFDNLYEDVGNKSDEPPSRKVANIHEAHIKVAKPEGGCLFIAF